MKTMLRILIVSAALAWPDAVIPEQAQTEWWREGVLGAPCSTSIDIEEGTCKIEVRKPYRVKERKRRGFRK